MKMKFSVIKKTNYFKKLNQKLELILNSLNKIADLLILNLIHFVKKYNNKYTYI